MIFWIASYPKSGNTWLRTLISSYYYSKDGVYNQKLIQNIGQFPEKKQFIGFDYLPQQQLILQDFGLKRKKK